MSTAVHLPRPEDFQPGQLVDDRYRVEARLAHGGMATVYRAWDNRLDRPVALKVIDAGLARRPEYVARFIREAKSAARLSHPNIVGVYDQSAITPRAAAGAGPLAYLAMEYVPGSTLRQLLGRRGRLTPRQALQVLDTLLAGLGAAHRAGIVHRDIKPENVLVNDAVLAQSHSYAAALKVTDFGLARSVEPGADGHTLAGSLPGSGLIGTASYLAPELVQFGTCDQRSDVYSAGIVLYELLTGRKPFTADSPLAVAQMHVTSRVPPPSLLVPGLDPSLNALVARATARDPRQRPADANELRTELRAVYASLPDAALDFGSCAVRGEATQALRADAAQLNRTRPDPAAARQATMTSPLPPVLPRRRPDEPYRYVEEGARRPRRYRGLIIFVVVILLAAAVGLGAFIYGSTHYQSMPELSGLSENAAEHALDNDGLHYRIATVPNPTVQSGYVVTTDPGSGRPIAVGGTVTLEISSGPAVVAIPSVAGLDQNDARDKLTQAGFNVAFSGTQYSDVQAGDAAATDPTGTAPQGSTITVILSAGPQQVLVPKVTGMSVTDATNELQGMGFHVTTHHVTLFLSTVLTQSPGGGSYTNPGGTVTLYY